MFVIPLEYTREILHNLAFGVREFNYPFLDTKLVGWGEFPISSKAFESGLQGVRMAMCLRHELLEWAFLETLFSLKDTGPGSITPFTSLLWFISD